MRGTSEIKLRPKSFQVMQYLIEHHGRLVTREELMRAVWEDVAVTDESLTKCIADIRKALVDHSQEIIRTVTRRGFLFQAEVRRIEPPQAAPQLLRFYAGHSFLGGRVMLLAGLVIFAFLLAVVWFQWRGRAFSRSPAFEAIAVLPLESLSDGADEQYLADGMTEALITDLGQASPLRVIARTSVNRYQKTKKSIQEIARELNVDVVVEGTVAQSGDHVRVTANLIQVSPEQHIWARSYERDLRDVLALQNELAAAVAAEIQGKLTPQQQAHLRTSRPVNPEAQLAYWKALYFLHGRRDPEGARKSIEYAEHAVGIDPSYAPAWAALSMSYAELGFMGGVLPNEIMPRARIAAQRSLALDESLAEAHVALGWILSNYDWDWPGAERETKRAVSLNPSDAQGHQALAHYFAYIGRVDEAVGEAKRARELDPFSFTVNHDVGKMLYWDRKYDEALAELRQVRDMQPDSVASVAVDIFIAKSCFKKGLYDEAVAADLRIQGIRAGLSTESLEALRAAYAKKGLRGYWMKLRELVLQSNAANYARPGDPLTTYRSNPNGVYHLAEINVHLDDKEEAFKWLEKAYEYRSGWLSGIKVDATFDPLRSDPRFSALLQRMGLAP